MVELDFSNAPPITYWEVLTADEKEIKAEKMAGGVNNTEPTKDGVHIPRELIRDWATSSVDPFPDLDDAVAYAQSDPVIWKVLNTNIHNREYHRIVTGPAIPIN